MQAGGPEVLELGEIKTPKPGPGEVLVNVEAAGVSFIDARRRSGPLPILTDQYKKWLEAA
jgi:NADPH2:quinone reductase